MVPKVILIACFLFTSTACYTPKIIFDTDIGGDADDLGALAMLHHFVDRGEADLLGIMLWTTEQYAVPAVDAVNRYYGHPDIPIGRRRGDPYYEAWNYNKPIVDSFPNELTWRDVPDATVLYRQILAGSKNKSIVIVTVGPLLNIQNLIQSGADSISPLSGRELIEQKVKEFVIMGGQFPQGESEWNFNGNMPGVTHFVIENLTVPITFSGYEVGLVIQSGEVLNEATHSPLTVGFRHFSQNASWVKDAYQGRILDNASYDQTAVLYAVRGGVGDYWEKVEGGYVKADEKGGNVWVEEPGKNHAYLKLKRSPVEMGELIEKMMLGDF